MATELPTRSGWPLLVVAALSFVPGFGLCFAAGAVTWGLITNRRHARLGVVIAGTGALLNVAAAVILVRRMEHGGAFRQVAVVQARQDLTQLALELERYRDRTGHYPASLPLLVGVPIPTHLFNIYDQTQGVFHLPRTYEYHLSPDGGTYDLFSAGPDGVPHTADDIRPDLPDSVSRHTGYRPAHPTGTRP